MRKTNGSILLEIAIGISIIGVICGGMISYFSISNKMAYNRTTKENIETVTLALASFVSKKYRLPNAADDLNGEEGRGDGKYVPYKALGISAKIAKDGRGDALIYAVEPALTHNFDCIYESNISSFGFCRKTENPVLVVSQTSESQIAFAIDVQNGGIDFQRNRINVTSKEYTQWVSKDMLLMKYLKSRPCHDITDETSASVFSMPHASNDDEFDF